MYSLPMLGEGQRGIAWKDRISACGLDAVGSNSGYSATMAWCLEQGLLPGWFRAWIFREQRMRAEALWKQEQVYLYVGEHSEVDHLYVVDNNAENRYASGFLCHELHVGVDLLPDIRALEAILEQDRQS